MARLEHEACALDKTAARDLQDVTERKLRELEREILLVQLQDKAEQLAQPVAVGPRGRCGVGMTRPPAPSVQCRFKIGDPHL